MLRQSLDAVRMPVASSTVRRSCSTLRPKDRMHHHQSPSLAYTPILLHLRRLVHIRAMTGEGLDALHMTLLSCNDYWSRAVLPLIQFT